MNDLNKQIEVAAPFQAPATADAPEPDHSEQAIIGLELAGRQKPAEEVQQLKPIFPIPN